MSDDADDKSPKPKPGDPDYVGYGHPPKAHQFAKGRSGNPRGRPKKATQDDSLSEYETLMRQMHTVIEDGRPVKRSARSLLMKRFVLLGLKGDLRALAHWLKLERDVGALQSPPEKEEMQQQYGVLVVEPPMSEAEYLRRFGGRQPQPTLPILEEFRKELGLPPTNEEDESS